MILYAIIISIANENIQYFLTSWLLIMEYSYSLPILLSIGITLSTSDCYLYPMKKISTSVIIISVIVFL